MPRVNVKDKRKQQLMDANIASIAKRGLSETTIAHVSQGAGMSRGIVNFYFTTKESMMQETCQFLADEYAGAWERALEKVAVGSSPRVALDAIIQSCFHASLCNQKKLSVWVAFWGHASSHNEYRKIIAEGDQAFTNKLSELWSHVATSQAVSVVPDAFAYELYSLIRGSWLHFLLSSSASERDALVKRCMAYVDRAAQAEGIAVAIESLANVTDIHAETGKKSGQPKKKKQAAPVVQEEAPALGDLFSMSR